MRKAFIKSRFNETTEAPQNEPKKSSTGKYVAQFVGLVALGSIVSTIALRGTFLAWDYVGEKIRDAYDRHQEAKQQKKENEKPADEF